MAITAAGLYGLSLEKMMNDGAAINLEAETNRILMVTDTYTPAFDTHDFVADVTNEVSGTGYTAGGNLLTATELTLSGGVLTFDAADPTWPTSTITDAMAAIIHADPVASDPLICLLDFVTAASSSGGTFTIALAASGIFTVDYTP